jgi:hypothetical protein
LDGTRQWPSHDLFPATLSYEAWRAKHFTSGELADPTVSGDNADPDGDGLANLLEYANGVDPRTSSPAPRLTAAFDSEGTEPQFVVSFRRLLLAHEIDYTLESSDDLKSWSSVSAETSERTLNQDGTVTTQTRIGMTEAPRTRFFRLRVSRKAQ